MIENLKKYFKNCDKSKLTMKFSETENILGVPLVKEAYKYDSFWYKKRQMICQVHGSLKALK